MKKLVFLTAIILIAAVYPFSVLKAQYPIPSYDVVLYQYDANFNEETEASSNPFARFGPMEERKINVRVEDPQPNQSTWAEIIIYSMDGTTVLGPYLVLEGITHVASIDDGEWSLQVVNCLAGCKLSVWID